MLAMSKFSKIMGKVFRSMAPRASSVAAILDLIYAMPHNCSCCEATQFFSAMCLLLVTVSPIFDVKPARGAVVSFAKNPSFSSCILRNATMQQLTIQQSVAIEYHAVDATRINGTITIEPFKS